VIIRNYLRALLITGLTGGYAVQLSAQDLDVTSYHAAICQGNGKFHEDRLKVNETGISNKSSSDAIWVTCPVPARIFDSPFTISYVSLLLTNSGDVARKVSCILDGGDMTGAITSQSRTGTVDPSDISELDWEFSDAALAVASIRCKLPPNAGVAAFIIGSGSL